jgi:hypothetical protein
MVNITMLLGRYQQTFDEVLRAKPRLELRIASATWTEKKQIRIVTYVENVGGGDAKIDPGMFADFLHTRLMDIKGNTVHFRGDNLGFFAALDPSHPVHLGQGALQGVEFSVEPKAFPALILVQEILNYDDPMDSGKVWKGLVKSNIVVLKTADLRRLEKRERGKSR